MHSFLQLIIYICYLMYIIIYHTFRCHFHYQWSTVTVNVIAIAHRVQECAFGSRLPWIVFSFQDQVLQAAVCHCRHSHHRKSAPLTCRPYMEDAEVESDSDVDPLEAR